MDMSERIKRRMRALSLKSVDLVKQTGASKGAISHWVNGTSQPSGENLFSLARCLQCSPEWLLTGEDEDKKSEVREANAHWHPGFELWDNDTPLRDDEVALPFFREVELAAGNGSTFIQENGDFKLRFAKSTLKKSNVDPQYAACVTVSGDSMLPVLQHGTTVGVDTSKKTIIDGKMYAIDHDGMLRVKMLYRIPGRGIRVKSYNNDEYPDEIIQPDQMSNFKIIGWVFWWSVLNVWNN
ncbi:S24 family peptidase [Shewanella baltica]|uniref:S24 family peptidase n=1 Tax=Shewanella baltica TaxID=62322 RepID=UPI000E1B7A16|nr:S24 family peptidase [Shewanella baltica]